MQTVDGKVSKFLYNASGILNGFVLGRGQEIRFWISDANVGAVTETMTVGSRVEIQGDLQRNVAEEEYLQAALVTNLDSKRTASLPAPVCLGKPGMLSNGAPNTVASLAHLRIADPERQVGTGSPVDKAPGAIAFYLWGKASHPEQSASSPDQHSSGSDAVLTRATTSDAATGIERAFDGLHRIHAILAYLHIVTLHVPGIRQFLDEAKHTYKQALALYAAHDFEGAREFAAACECLSRVVEMVISRTLRSDTSCPTMVLPPPEHPTTSGESAYLQDRLNEVESVLSRLHWLLENGTLPLEDRTQVRRIASWGDAFYQQTRRMYRSGSLEDASELVRAAHSAAHSAEHVCRNWYVAHALNPRLISAERSPQP
jgi:hypothetical protein